MKNRTVMLLVVVILALVAAHHDVAAHEIIGGGSEARDWELVVDAEAHSDGTVVATRQARASTCVPDGEGACVISWDWEADLPADANEWVKARFLQHGATIPIVFVPEWCEVDLELCQAALDCDGETTVFEPSAECLAQLSSVCDLEPDANGFWYAGALPKDEGDYYAFYEPLGEWYDNCPLPPDTATPAPTQPTYTPAPSLTPWPTPTCMPTWTPIPTDTPYPTHTPYPTSTPYPTQPPF